MMEGNQGNNHDSQTDITVAVWCREQVFQLHALCKTATFPDELPEDEPHHKLVNQETESHDI